MASMARVLTSVDVWTQFRCLTEHHVDEGNFVAGERLWEVVPSDEPADVLTIRSTRSIAHAIECAFDDSCGALTCAPGAAIAVRPLTFQVLPELPGIVRCDGRDYTVDEAVNRVLDELVWDDADQGDRA